MHFSALSHKIDCILVCSAEQMGKKMFSCELHSQCETFEFDDEPHIYILFIPFYLENNGAVNYKNRSMNIEQFF